mmetsp:Transcript_10045/g.21315  ORF Transcript_10045/g.21315 Transcript_10045/m.21315 type:complete len:442 (+) Transcript_10045:143-1468(+)
MGVPVHKVAVEAHAAAAADADADGDANAPDASATETDMNSSAGRKSHGTMLPPFTGTSHEYEYVAWFILLIATVESFVGLDLPQLITDDGSFVHWSLHGVNLSILFLNVSGSFLEGFFASWDEGWGVDTSSSISSSSSSSCSSFSVSGVVRDSFLAAYMSWVAMIEHGGDLSQLHGSPWVGDAYCVVTIALGLVAHVVGVAVAWAVSVYLLPPTMPTMSNTCNGTGDNGESAPAPIRTGIHVRISLLVGLASYVASAFVRCYMYRAKNDHDGDADIFQYPNGFEIEIAEGYSSALILIPSLANSAPLRLAVSILFSTVGAYAGNCVGENIVANVLFTCLNLFCRTVLLSTNMPLSWLLSSYSRRRRSHLLSAFMGSFCGSGSSFGGMCTGIVDGLLLNTCTCSRNDDKKRKRDAALWSLFLHLVSAAVFVHAYYLYGHYFS